MTFYPRSQSAPNRAPTGLEPVLRSWRSPLHRIGMSWFRLGSILYPREAFEVANHDVHKTMSRYHAREEATR